MPDRMLTERVRQASAPRQDTVICSGASVPYRRSSTDERPRETHHADHGRPCSYNDGGSSKQRGMDCLTAGSTSVPTANKNNFSAQVSID